MTRYQHQFESDSDRSRRVRTAIRDSFFHILIIIASFLAIAGIAWLQVNGEIVDTHVKHILK